MLESHHDRVLASRGHGGAGHDAGDRYGSAGVRSTRSQRHVAVGPDRRCGAVLGVRSRPGHHSKAEDAWKALQEASRTSRDGGDSTTLLALFAMREDPVRLFDVVLVLSPAPDAPSWLHPMRRWNVMTAWVRRNSELATEVRSLAESGLLRRTERGRWWEDMSFYEATGLGRDVAVRNAEVLMAGRIEEEA